eukprot:Awhi_evm1s5889
MDLMTSIEADPNLQALDSRRNNGNNKAATSTPPTTTTIITTTNTSRKSVHNQDDHERDAKMKKFNDFIEYAKRLDKQIEQISKQSDNSNSGSFCSGSSDKKSLSSSPSHEDLNFSSNKGFSSTERTSKLVYFSGSKSHDKM